MRTGWMSPRLERALRWSAVCHAGQTRKASDVPYFEHAAAVAMILDRAGFDEDVVIAGLLHDVVEDTEATLDDVAAGSVRPSRDRSHCSEIKFDAEGRKRPWIDRKRDHLAAMAGAAGRRPGPSSSPTSSTTSRASSSTWTTGVRSGTQFNAERARSSGITGRRSRPAHRAIPGSRRWPRPVARCSTGSRPAGVSPRWNEAEVSFLDSFLVDSLPLPASCECGLPRADWRRIVNVVALGRNPSFLPGCEWPRTASGTDRESPRFHHHRCPR